jgi:hypothetical protein
MSQPSKWEEFRHVSEEFHRKRIERLRHTEDLPPPWEAFPMIPRGSIGWRMGSGEDYIGDWYRWIQALTLPQFEAYQARHPAPGPWQSIYINCLKNVEAATAGKSWNEYWDAEFERQKAIIQSQVEIMKRHEKD